MTETRPGVFKPSDLDQTGKVYITLTKPSENKQIKYPMFRVYCGTEPITLQKPSDFVMVLFLPLVKAFLESNKHGAPIIRSFFDELSRIGITLRLLDEDPKQVESENTIFQ